MLTSYMTGCSRFSMMERRPRAPVPRSRAAWAIDRLAGCVMCMRARLMPNIRSYCFASAFLGFVSTSMSSASVSVCKALQAQQTRAVLNVCTGAAQPPSLLLDADRGCARGHSQT